MQRSWVHNHWKLGIEGVEDDESMEEQGGSNRLWISIVDLMGVNRCDPSS